MADVAPKKKCLVPTCNRTDMASRGLCALCYQLASNAIRESKTTWDELIALGLAYPAKRPGGKHKSGFTIALDAARAEHQAKPTTDA